MFAGSTAATQRRHTELASIGNETEAVPIARSSLATN